MLKNNINLEFEKHVTYSCKRWKWIIFVSYLNSTPLTGTSHVKCENVESFLWFEMKSKLLKCGCLLTLQLGWLLLEFLSGKNIKNYFKECFFRFWSSVKFVPYIITFSYLELWNWNETTSWDLLTWRKKNLELILIFLSKVKGFKFTSLEDRKNICLIFKKHSLYIYQQSMDENI